MAKFTQQQAFDAIKAKLPNDRIISDRSINDALENLMLFATDETEMTDFLKAIYPTIKTMDGNLRSEIATKVKEIEDKTKKTPEEIEAEKIAAEKAKNEMPQWYRDAQAENDKKMKELYDRLEKQDSVKSLDEIRNSIIESDETKMWNRNIIDIAVLGFDFSKENAADEFKTHIATIGAKVGVKPVVPSSSEKTTSEKFSEMKKELSSTGMINTEAK